MKNIKNIKKIKTLLIIITISFLMSMHIVRAMEDSFRANLYIECENSITIPGKKVNCSINCSTNKKNDPRLKNILFNLSTDNDKVIIEDFQPAEGLILVSEPEEERYKFEFEYEGGNDSNFNVATFSLNVSESYKINNDVNVNISLSSVEFIFGMGGYTIAPVSATIVVRPNHNYLLGAKFIGYDIGFDINKTEYNLTVENKVLKLAVCNNYEDENMLCIDVNSVEFAAKTDITSFTLNDQDLELEEKLFNFDENIEKNCNEDEKICEYILIGNLKVGLNELKLIITGEEGSDEYIFKINRLSENRNDALTDSNKEEIIENPKTGAFISLSSLTFVAAVSTYAIVKLKKKNNFYD